MSFFRPHYVAQFSGAGHFIQFADYWVWMSYGRRDSCTGDNDGPPRCPTDSRPAGHRHLHVLTPAPRAIALLNPQYTRDAVHIMEEKGVRQHEGRLAFQVDEGAGHIESAWGHRLYGSLQFLCGHWWASPE